jgi:hypothetical protein
MNKPHLKHSVVSYDAKNNFALQAQGSESFYSRKAGTDGNDRALAL